jgi:glucokinase
MMKYAIGIDLGGSKIAGGVVNENGRVIEKSVIPTEAYRGKSHVVNSISNLVKYLLNKSKSKEVIGIGIGVPSPVNFEKGVIYFAPNLGWRNVNIRSELKKYFNLPIYVDNDANLAAYGEQWVGTGKNIKDFLYLTLGTGIGGGIILNGELYRGSNNYAGEFGHMTVEPDGRRCNCGARGCIEMYSSGKGIILSVKEMYNNGETTILEEKILKNNLTGEDVYLAAKEKKDSVAVKAFDTAGKYLGVALSSAVNLLDVRLVILGGNVSKAKEFILPSLKKELYRRLIYKGKGKVKVKFTRLEPSVVGIIGAARLVFANIG